ncbi:fatty acid desaturase [Magnetospirillum sp. UT-4]|uniref:fatty acid desaturase family protein n=1 Tax=Magnetospirillum sp. UT-4 TaxID=2681467 RepID=UPI001384740F|nr:fatty acid desaturase [Magnetospirillum sp. UT-4]CAA7612122.1 putative Fatty acid desaturase family protein [Magnetospirillum sp. UT-4]
MVSDAYRIHRRRLSAEVVRDLSRLRPRVAVRDTLLDWAFIVAAWAMAAWVPEPWLLLPCALVVGNRYYALVIIGHDGLHRRLFDDERLNDLWNDLFILGPVGAVTRLNRVNHILHHQRASTVTDPDRYKYTHDNKRTNFAFLAYLTGISVLGRSFGNIFRNRDGLSAESRRGEGYRPRDLVILAGWQGALVAGLTHWFGWWGYPVLWLVPVGIAYTVDVIRVFAEHSMLDDDTAADRTGRLITYASAAWERPLIAPHNMNFHAAHHLWPSIPYYSLPEADRRLRASGNGGQLQWRGLYLGYLSRYWRFDRSGRASSSWAT